MTPQELRELIDFISKSGFSHFEMEKDGFKIKLVRGGVEGETARVASAPAVGEGVVSEGNGRPAAAVLALAAPEPLDTSVHQIESPIVGTFFRAPGPDAEVFVEKGTVVSAGQTLCIVEAMKLMNEIDADIAGEIVEILVANGQPVEYGETLFRIRPSGA